MYIDSVPTGLLLGLRAMKSAGRLKGNFVMVFNGG